MRVAVIALFANAEQGDESVQWLEQMLQAMITDNGISQLKLYTNHAKLAQACTTGLDVSHVKQARFFWSRWRLQRLWRKQVEEEQTAAVLFFGLSSFFKTPLPAYFILQPRDLDRKKLLQKVTASYAFKQVLVSSKSMLDKVLDILGHPQKNILVIHGAPPAQNLIEWDPQLVKEKFTDGAEYFLCQGFGNNIDAVVLILKAFSRFKRRQKSGWKLVLVPEDGKLLIKLQELLSTYKYRADVVALHHPDAEVVQALYAGAYCFVLAGAPGHFGTALLRPLSWGLPLIATPACREWTENAALYFEPGNEEELATHLMTLYKDEGLRQKLFIAAAQRAADFSWQPLLQLITGGEQQA